MVSDKCKNIFILSFNNLWNSFNLTINVSFGKVWVQIRLFYLLEVISNLTNWFFLHLFIGFGLLSVMQWGKWFHFFVTSLLWQLVLVNEDKLKLELPSLSPHYFSLFVLNEKFKYFITSTLHKIEMNWTERYRNLYSKFSEICNFHTKSESTQHRIWSFGPWNQWMQRIGKQHLWIFYNNSKMLFWYVNHARWENVFVSGIFGSY